MHMQRKNNITYLWRSLYRHLFILYGATCWTPAGKSSNKRNGSGVAHWHSTF